MNELDKPKSNLSQASIDRPKPKNRTRAPSAATLAKQEQRQIEKTIKRYEYKVAATKQRIEKNKERAAIIKKVNEGPSDEEGKFLEDVEFAKVPPAKREELEAIFRPLPGPQTSFFESNEREVLYGGAAGGGKSQALIVDCIRDSWHPQHRGIIFRRYIDELRDLIAKTKELYPQIYPKAKWNKQESTWTFPSGASVWYTYLESEDDVTRYQGQAFNYIGFDELTQWPTPYCWNYLRSRLRTTASDLGLFMRATTNPGNVGSGWVKKMFIDPSAWDKAFWATDIETGRVLTWPNRNIDGTPHRFAGLPLFKRRFIPARLSDNPYLWKDGEYEKNLLSLPEAQRKRLLEGDWNVVDGAAFPEFNRAVHVCAPFKLPSSWVRFRAADYGYGSPACCLWMCSDGEGRIFVYKELYGKGMDHQAFADRINEIEAEMGERCRYGILDAHVWDRRGERSPSPAEVMNSPPYRLGWRKSDSSPNSRLAGKLELHRRLKSTPSSFIKAEDGTMIEYPGRPMVQIFENCVNLIRTLPMLPIDSNDCEDVDTEAEDHAYDALRYGIMSRPMRPDFGFNSMFPAKVTASRNPVDPVFGY